VAAIQRQREEQGGGQRNLVNRRFRQIEPGIRLERDDLTIFTRVRSSDIAVGGAENSLSTAKAEDAIGCLDNDIVTLGAETLSQHGRERRFD
jgi:hypothetical protein